MAANNSIGKNQGRCQGSVYSGALRPGSSTKKVILVLNGNGLLNYFQIRHLDIAMYQEVIKC